MTTRTERRGAVTAPDPKLVFRNGALRGKVLALERERIALGRDPQNDVAIENDIVSSFHAVLERDGDGHFWLRDAGSKNGTYLNGQRTERTRLQDGDVFCLARAGPEIQFTVGEPSLPSLLSTSTHTLLRTGSVSRALREILPSRRGATMNTSGVRQIVDGRLEEMSKRSQRAILTSAGLVSLSLLFAAALFLFFSMRRSPEAARERPDVALQLEVKPIYSSLFNSYATTPVGEVRVINKDRSSLRASRLKITFEKQISTDETLSFLDEELVLDVPALPAGERFSAPLRPLFSEAIVSRRTRRVTVHAVLEHVGEEIASTTRAVKVYGHSVFTWDNPEKLAAYVDPEDDAVVAFVQAALAYRPWQPESEFPPRNMLSAATLLTALAERGIQYKPDALDGDSEAAERVNYPWETLLLRTGDCDDLAVLCCSVLQAAGVPTAFAVGSDHILMLLDSGYVAGDADGIRFAVERFVEYDGRFWIPVETTNLTQPDSDFLTAWLAADWRRSAIAKGDLKLVEVAAAWKALDETFKPPLPEHALEMVRDTAWVDLDLTAQVGAVLQRLRETFLKELQGRVDELRQQFDGLAFERERGLLYARCNFYPQAREVFETAVFERLPPLEALRRWSKPLDAEELMILSNLGIVITLSYQHREELSEAVSCYELCLRNLAEDDIARGEILLRLALVHRLRGDPGAETDCREKAFSVDPSLELTYQDLIAGVGTVAQQGSGLSAAIFRALRADLR